MVKKVRSLAISGGVTLAVLAGLAILASRTNAGNFLLDNLRGFGKNVGAGIVAPFTGIVEGVNQGGQGLFSAAGDAGANIQEAFTGNRNAIGDFFANLGNPSGQTNNSPSQSTIDVSNVSRNTVQRNVNSGVSSFGGIGRVTQDLINIGVTGNPESPDFGGFGNAANQQEALKRLLEENKKKFPQFFQ